MPKPTPAFSWLRLNLIWLLFVAAGIAGYLFLYVSSQESYLCDRALRRLATIARDLEAKIGEVEPTFERIARKAAELGKQEALDDYVGMNAQYQVKQAPAEDASNRLTAIIDETMSRIPVLKRARPGLSEHSSNQLTAIINETVSLIPWLEPASPEWLESVSPEVRKPLEGRQLAVRTAIQFQPGAQGGLLTFIHRRGENDPPSTQFAGKSTLPRMMDSVDEKGEFDDVIVAFEDGTVIYQRDRDEMVLTDLSTCRLPGGSGLDTRGIRGSSSVAIQIANEGYQLFLQPMRTALPVIRPLPGAAIGKSSASSGEEVGGDVQSPKQETWLVAGLLRQRRLAAESRVLPTSVTLALLLLVLSGLLAAPFLKAWYLGDQERFSAFDAALLLASILVTTTVGTILFLDTLQYRRLIQRLDESARKIAIQVVERFTNEMDAAHTQLQTLFPTPPLPSDRSDRLWALDPNLPDGSNLNRDRFRVYPFFDQVFWADSDGEQRRKWSVRKQTTPRTPVADRTYFKAASLPPTPAMGTPSDRRFYAVDIVRSMNTGETVATLAMPLDQTTGASAGEGRDVAAMVTRPISLCEPVLPRDFGFLLIDERGEEVLQANRPRSGQENFFSECENDGSLVSAVLARRAEALTVHYLGRQHRVYVHPMAPHPWTLVVYRDTAMLSTINMEIALVSLLLYCTPVILFLGVAVLIRLFSRTRRPTWYWPERSYTCAYIQGTVLIVSLGAWLVWAIAEYSGDRLFRMVIGVPVACPLLLRVCLWREERLQGRKAPEGWVADLLWQVPALLVAGVLGAFTEDVFAAVAVFTAVVIATSSKVRERLRVAVDRRPHAAFRLSVVCLGVSLLFVESAGPAVGLFRDAFRHGMNEFVMLNERHWAHTRSDRDRRFVERFGRDLASNPLATLDIYEAESLRRASAPKPKQSSDDTEVRSPFTSRIMSLLPIYNPVTTQLRRISATVDHPSYEASTPAAIESWSLEPERTRWLVPRVVLVTGLALLAALVLYAVTRRVFGTDLESESALSRKVRRLPAIRECRLLLQPPQCTIDALRSDAALQFVDLAESPTAPPTPATRTEAVVLDRFELGLADPVIASARLAQLESLVFKDQKRVVLISDIDPIPYFEDRIGELPEEAKRESALNELDRWSSVLSRFQRGPFVLDRWKPIDSGLVGSAKMSVTLRDECGDDSHLASYAEEIVEQPSFPSLSEDQVIEELGVRAEAYYRSLWSHLSTSEKLILIHVAQEGFVNPKRWGIVRRLRSRGLIRKDPGLRLMNESFRRFVVHAELPATVKRWEAEKKGLTWARLQGPLMIVAIAVAAFFFFTQRDETSAAIGFVTTLAGVVPTVVRLISSLHAQRATGPAPVNVA